jgi:hypothetical protein
VECNYRTESWIDLDRSDAPMLMLFIGSGKDDPAILPAVCVPNSNGKVG